MIDMGQLPDGRRVQAVDLQAGRLRARVLTLGGIVQDLRLDGIDHPLVLGHPDPATYLTDPFRHVGALVGRYANRIAGARIRLSGRVHDLDANEGPNCLHGGTDGASVRLWRITRAAPDAVTLALDFADGEMGFPGAMQALATLSLGDHDGTASFSVALQATATRPTPCNLTHHGYWTLSPDGAADQMLQIDADCYLPVDDALIPLPDAPAPVTGTRFDFRTARPLGDAGLDHCWCLADGHGPLRQVASLTAPDLRLRVLTTAPGLQVYDGGHFPQTGLAGHPSQIARPQSAVAFEAQEWPDAPNRPDFPPTILRPGTVWRTETRYLLDRT
ncbi:aldose epimerase family protein [Paracoccus marcusii]|uniref:aldose epimerase family protein n=1 Tax=Paracoccus marcusii TaxID=59779 RepID=UPI0032662579